MMAKIWPLQSLIAFGSFKSVRHFTENKIKYILVICFLYEHLLPGRSKSVKGSYSLRATSKVTKLRSCVKVEVDVLGSRP